MKSFSIENRFGRKVSCNQFKKTAERLEFTLKAARLLAGLPAIKSELLLTTDKNDYDEARETGTFTSEKEKIITSERLETLLERREKYQLEDLNEELWGKSFKTELYIMDNPSTHYLVWLGHEIMQPRRLFFCGHYLDKESQKILERFSRGNLLQKSGGGGFPKMIAQARYYSFKKLLENKALIENR